MNNHLKALAFLICILLLSACGGSGGSGSIPSDPIDDTPTTPTTTPTPSDTTQTSPNILLIISDDQGLDASAQFGLSVDVPNTPTLDGLAQQGIVFENAWATPSCTTTRASLLTGKHGINSGITSTPGTLSTDMQTIQSFLAADQATSDYNSGVFGKWHVGGNAANHPATVGIEYFAGNISNITDYFSWDLTTNGTTETITDYHTTKITDLAIDWIADQQAPWFAWVAYSAPHSPYHLPPSDLHDRGLSGTTADIDANKRDYYLSAIEAMDSEIGRLLNSMTENQLENTVIFYIGDNGTPRNVIDGSAYVAASHGKGSLYEGGINVPMVVAGAGVTRANERETALVNTTDFFSTIAELAGSTATTIYDSVSFAGSLSTDQWSQRTQNYSEFESNDYSGWAIRNADYKLIQLSDGSQQLFNMNTDSNEEFNLLPGSAAEQAIRDELTLAAEELRGEGGSTGNPSSGSPIDITDAILNNQSVDCASYVESYSSMVSDVATVTLYEGDLVIAVSGNKCSFTTNAIPNHDFNDGNNAFPNPVSAQNDVYEITNAPAFASSNTELSLEYDNAILLNGVKTDLLAAACFGVGNEKTGCNNINQPWRFDPMFSANGFSVDSHNAHTQPDGTYHYHGTPHALFLNDTAIESPVIGFAADGFPIFGSYFNDGTTVRKATSSHQLKSGSRPTGANDPGGNYDGTFRDDYEFIQGSGDLDECNGMTVDGNYGYYVTESYPYILSCFKGSPDISFKK